MSYPRTQPPPHFSADIVHVFEANRAAINTVELEKGLTSNEVLAVVASGLASLGFHVETGAAKTDKIDRPVFFGENGQPALRYQVDGYHPEWRCGLEIEAGRAWMGNAIYRDLIQALVMVEVDYLCLAVSQHYKYNSGGRAMISRDFENAVGVADALYGHSRMSLPYGLLLIGY